VPTSSFLTLFSGPIYICEYAHAHLRGRVIANFQIEFISFRDYGLLSLGYSGSSLREERAACGGPSRFLAFNQVPLKVTSV
jgi:hypothetical protein